MSDPARRSIVEYRDEQRAAIRVEWARMMGQPWPVNEHGEPLPVLLDVDIDWGLSLGQDALMAIHAAAVKADIQRRRAGVA